MATYEQKKQQALQLFSSAISFAQQSKQQEYVKQLQAAAQHLDEGKFMIVVCGEFRRGKSSLLNAFLNEVQDIFPVDIAITTNLVTTITYGPTEKITAWIGPEDSDNLKEVRISRTDIRKYVTEKDNPRNEREARLMVIETPNEQLKQGLVLVDTPGVGGLYARHTDVTYEFIPRADAILFVSDALQPLSEDDLKFIKERILRHNDRILFALTKKDKVKDYKVMVENTRQKLAATLGCSADAVTIIPISSYAKRNYLKTHDPEDLEDSNFPQLESTLWQFVGAYRGSALLAKALTVLGPVVADMRRPLQVELDACQEQNKQKLNEIESSLQEVRDYLQRLLDNGAYWQTQLRDGLEDIRTDIQHQFDRGFADIRKNADGYLQDDDMVRLPEKLLGPVQRDINDLLYAIDRSLNEQAADLQSRIEFTTGLALNPFEPDSLHQQSKALTLRGVPPAPRQDSSWDKMIVTGQRASMMGTFGGTTLAFVGNVVGAIVGLPFLGTLIGGAVGLVAGARSGAKQAMRQMREQERQHISKYLMSLLADTHKEHSHSLTKTIKELERAMRDDLVDKIKREKHSREQALKSFQEARNLTAAQANARIALLRGPLQQFDQLQRGIETLAKATMERDNDPPTPSAHQSANQQGSSATNDADTGGWADE